MQRPAVHAEAIFHVAQIERRDMAVRVDRRFTVHDVGVVADAAEQHVEVGAAVEVIVVAGGRDDHDRDRHDAAFQLLADRSNRGAAESVVADQHVAPAAAEQAVVAPLAMEIVGAAAALERVGSGRADHPVGAAVSDQIDRSGQGRGIDVFDVLRQHDLCDSLIWAVERRGREDDRVVSTAGQFHHAADPRAGHERAGRVRFEDGVGQQVVDVVARAAHQDVGAFPTLEHVVAGQPVERLRTGIAAQNVVEFVAAAGGVGDHSKVFDAGTEGV